MLSRSISERILRGREASQRLEDEYLNEKLDELVTRWMSGIVNASPREEFEILEAKRRIDAVEDLRRLLRVDADDGYLAHKEQEEAQKKQ